MSNKQSRPTMKTISVAECAALQERLTSWNIPPQEKDLLQRALWTLVVLFEQLDQKQVEPNSSLGHAINYMLNHWLELTLFLRVEGAPLDSNAVERILKKAILNRKKAYFYRTEFGATVGDMIMSIIETCRLNKVNPFQYLITLQDHAQSVRRHPEHWLPWNYHRNLALKKAS